jgi:hypothetical protein
LGSKGSLLLAILVFLILKKLGHVAYKLELSPSLAGMHDVFHVSQLKKCLKAPTDVVVNDVTPLGPIYPILSIW